MKLRFLCILQLKLGQFCDSRVFVSVEDILCGERCRFATRYPRSCSDHRHGGGCRICTVSWRVENDFMVTIFSKYKIFAWRMENSKNIWQWKRFRTRSHHTRFTASNLLDSYVFCGSQSWKGGVRFSYVNISRS